MHTNNPQPSNPSAQQCVHNVLAYLAQIKGKKVITGQHTQDMPQPELYMIQKQTGKMPALLGFELLSYSPNINYLDTDEECMTEVADNRGTLQRAWEWSKEKGLVTFTWHWFSPLGGRSKSFFTENTEYDVERAVMEETPEYRALISDMDMMAGLLRPFADAGIPILWRPFHEGEGKWFWWGAKGPEPLKAVYRLMYERFTKLHHLDNLIWVWNSPLKECYPGDDVVDVVTRDMYPPAHEHTACRAQYEELLSFAGEKSIAIGEIGVVPDVDAICNEGLGWTYYMTWSHDFCLTEKSTTYDYLRQLYHSPHAVTKDNLPALY